MVEAWRLWLRLAARESTIGELKVTVHDTSTCSHYYRSSLFLCFSPSFCSDAERNRRDVQKDLMEELNAALSLEVGGAQPTKEQTFRCTISFVKAMKDQVPGAEEDRVQHVVQQPAVAQQPVVLDRDAPTCGELFAADPTSQVDDAGSTA